MVKPRTGSITKAVARSSLSHKSLKFIMVKAESVRVWDNNHHASEIKYNNTNKTKPFHTIEIFNRNILLRAYSITTTTIAIVSQVVSYKTNILLTTVYNSIHLYIITRLYSNKHYAILWQDPVIWDFHKELQKVKPNFSHTT